MPVPLRMPYHKAEAKYNVTTEFPSLGLHSAAATGNVGLVEYALDHGQPINSVLDGVLPLHAACAGGNVQVVKVLIDHGADVNAPRLPRKYSIDKNRDSSAPIVGTSGSTPLHFAAANGNTDVVTLLLLHGAHADRADKHGVTPEMLAQQNGWIECAKVLNNWILNKDQDLRAREGTDTRLGSGTGPHGHEQQSSRHAETIHCSFSSRRGLHVKQSIDTALNMLKSTDSQSRGPQLSQTSTPPSSPPRPLGEYSFYSTDPLVSSPIDPTVRRPSLPHILQLHSNEHIRDRNSSLSNSLSESAYHRRPRSAGTGSDQQPEQEVTFPVYGRGGYGRKLGSKYSLLNIFKKAQSGEPSGSSGNFPEAASTRDSPSDLEFSRSTTTIPLAMTQSHLSQLSNTDSNENLNPMSSSTSTRPGLRFHRGSDASNKGSRLIPQAQSLTSSTSSMTRKASGSLRTPPRSNVPLVELQIALAQQQQHRIRPGAPGTPNEVPRTFLDADERGKPSSPLARFTPIHSPHNRNASVSSLNGTLDTTPIQDNDAVTTSDVNLELESGKPSPSPRPGILRAHNRTSSGQGSASNSRTLRFDSSPRRVRDKIDSPMLKSYDSSGSLSRLRIQTNGDSEQEPRATLIDVDELDHEENYGVPILPDIGSSLEKTLNVPSVLLQRQRGQSFTSSSESSLSPILTGDNVTDPTMTAINADFPFSINRPPSLMTEDHEDSFSPRGLLVPISANTRNRGSSLSSDGSTFDSRNLQLSFTSGSGTSQLVPTLGNGPIFPQDSDKIMSLVQDEVLETVQSHNGGLNERRAHVPLDIDLTSISSHAQAEALVERARREALDLAGTQDLSPLPTSTGRSPLSARLAAYGESLALERKLREQKEQKESIWNNHVQSLDAAGLVLSPLSSTLILKGPDGVERQSSLESKQGVKRVGRRLKDPRRPSTADGIHSPTSESNITGRSASHHSSHSASVANRPPTKSSNDTQNHSPIEQTSNSETMPPYTAVPVSSTKSDLNQPITSRALYAPPNESLSCITSLYSGADTETESPALYRVPTVPLPTTVRGKREVRSANKLTRMGYPANEQVVSRPSPTTPPTSGRFGAIKSFMQTFKGKA